MPVRSFLDTNVVVCADDNRVPAKQETAITLYEECRRAGRGVVSVQVLQEYFAAATQKLRVRAEHARRRVQLLAQLDVMVPQTEDVLAAIDLHRLHHLSLWDAMIVRAAVVAKCRRIYTENFDNHRSIDGVEIVNPFN